MPMTRREMLLWDWWAPLTAEEIEDGYELNEGLVGHRIARAFLDLIGHRFDGSETTGGAGSAIDEVVLSGAITRAIQRKP